MFHICFLCQTECFGLRPWSVNLRPDLPLVDAQFATSALGIFFSTVFLISPRFIFISSVGLHVSASARFATCPSPNLPLVDAQFATSALGIFFQLHFLSIHVSYLLLDPALKVAAGNLFPALSLLLSFWKLERELLLDIDIFQKC